MQPFRRSASEPRIEMRTRWSRPAAPMRTCPWRRFWRRSRRWNPKPRPTLRPTLVCHPTRWVGIFIRSLANTHILCHSPTSHCFVYMFMPMGTHTQARTHTRACTHTQWMVCLDLPEGLVGSMFSLIILMHYLGFCLSRTANYHWKWKTVLTRLLFHTTVSGHNSLVALKHSEVS